jgi:hypothetical protein
VAETRVKNFFVAGIDALVTRWDSLGGGYVQICRFFQVTISHVLSLVSICDLLNESPSKNAVLPRRLCSPWS